MDTGLRINVGCGVSPTPGWLNIDNSPTLLLGPISFLLTAGQRAFLARAKAEGVRYGTATRLPVADASAEVVYSSHMLEHLDPQGARDFLREARRVLQPGGVLRIVVPDLAITARDYLANGDAEFFMRTSQLGHERPRTLRAWLRLALFGRREHCWLYDGRSLAALIASEGFADTVIVSGGTTTIANPSGLNVAERMDWSACVEARRPV